MASVHIYCPIWVKGRELEAACETDASVLEVDVVELDIADSAIPGLDTREFPGEVPVEADTCRMSNSLCMLRGVTDGASGELEVDEVALAILLLKVLP
jgi:hypothetical protein